MISSHFLLAARHPAAQQTRGRGRRSRFYIFSLDSIRDTHPRMLKTGDCSVTSMMASMISSSSRKGTPPSVDPILPWNQYHTTRRMRGYLPVPKARISKSSKWSDLCLQDRAGGLSRLEGQRHPDRGGTGIPRAFSSIHQRSEKEQCHHKSW